MFILQRWACEQPTRATEHRTVRTVCGECSCRPTWPASVGQKKAVNTVLRQSTHTKQLKLDFIDAQSVCTIFHNHLMHDTSRRNAFSRRTRCTARAAPAQCALPRISLFIILFRFDKMNWHLCEMIARQSFTMCSHAFAVNAAGWAGNLIWLMKQTNDEQSAKRIAGRRRWMADRRNVNNEDVVDPLWRNGL